MKPITPPTHRVLNGYQFPYYSGSLADCRKVIAGMPDVFRIVSVADGSELPRRAPATDSRRAGRLPRATRGRARGFGGMPVSEFPMCPNDDDAREQARADAQALADVRTLDDWAEEHEETTPPVPGL